MLEKRHFHLGLNTDDADELLQDGEYRFALNIRSGSADEADVGAITNVKGNSLLTFTLPGGFNKVIGAKDDTVNRRVIYFLFNDQERHQIIQYSYENNTVSLIKESALFNFKRDKNVWHIDIVDGKLLYWTDNDNEPRKTNIERLLLPVTDVNAYPVPFKEQYINAIQIPPLCPPLVKYDSDPSKKANNLRGDLFQFKYLYVYPDSEKSVPSPISKLPLPVGEEFLVQAPLSGLPVQDNNVIKLTIEPGDRYVEKIQILARIGNLGDFFLVETLDRSDYGTTTFEYEFFNDGIYSSINLNESNKNFDRVPRKVAAQALLDGNRIAYGNFEEGRDAVEIDMKITPVYEFKTLNTLVGTITRTIFSTTKVKYTVGIVRPDNVYRINVSVIANNGTFEYFVVSDVTSTEEDIVDALVDQMNSDANNTFFTITKLSATEFEIESTNLQFATLGIVTPITRTVRGFKRGAYHEFVITYYDFANRSGAANRSDSSRVYVNFYPDTPDNQGVASLDIEINHQPPIWATKYQLLYSLNQTVANFIQFTTDNVIQSAPQILISLKTIERFATDNPNSILSYSFTRGDRVRFIRTSSTAPALNALIDVEVIGFNEADNQIIISNKIPFNVVPGTIFEIYTPKKEIEEKIYREIGECFDILNPGTDDRQHQGSARDQGPIVITVPQQTITQTVFAIKIVSDKQSVTLFTLNSSFITNLIDNGDIVVGAQVTLSNAGAYNGTFTVIKLRSVTSSNVANSYIRLQTGNLGPINNPDAVMTIVIPAQFGGGAALIELRNEGDVYYKERRMSISTGAPSIKRYFVEDFNYSDFYESANTNIGRPNVVDPDFKEVRRTATVFISETFISDTNINGLNSFFGFSFPDFPPRAKDYDKSLGSIQRLYAENRTLICFQELKVGKILTNESVIFDLTGIPTINKSNEILSDMIPYAGEWGIGTEPGSFAVYGQRKYFADMRRGSVLRLSQNGITEISENKMHNYFTDTFKASIEGLENPPTLYAVYDKRFDEYILSIELSIEQIVCPGLVHKVAGSTHVDIEGDPNNFVHTFVHALVDAAEITQIDIGEDKIGLFADSEFVRITYFDRDIAAEVTKLVPVFGISGTDLRLLLISLTALNDGDTVTVRIGGGEIITSEDIISTFGNPFPGTNVLAVTTTDFDFIVSLGITVIQIEFLDRTSNTVIQAFVLINTFAPPTAFIFDLPSGTSLDNGDQVRILNLRITSEIVERFETIAFNENHKRWKTFYSYEPEMMVSADTDIVTFKDGIAFRHNDNDIRNNFYGEQFSSIVELVFNVEFEARKFWLSIMEQANKIWAAIRITNQLGQKTNLIDADFEDIEGDFFAEILQDENTPVADPLIEGDDMRSHELTVRLENKDTDNVRMITVGVISEPSERTNK